MFCKRFLAYITSTVDEDILHRHGRDNLVLFREQAMKAAREGPVQCWEGLGRLFKIYHRGFG